MDNKTHISVVSPVYKGEKMLAELVRRITESVSTITDLFEIILVNDASPDHSWEEIKKACAKDKRVKGVQLCRNFGQHYAISAGLLYAKGDWVVVMDCDLQDRPEEIPNLYRKAQEGWNVVSARRVKRKDNFIKKFSSILFHAAYDYLSGLKTDTAIGIFGIYSQKVISEYNKMDEIVKSFMTMTSYLGFNSTAIDVQHDARAEGKSSYTLSKLLKLTFDVIISNSNKPLRLTVELGFFMSFISFLLALYNLIAHWIGIIQVAGFTTTVFSIWFVGGLILFVLGIIGLYVGKIFNQVKNRPPYVVENVINIP